MVYELNNETKNLKVSGSLITVSKTELNKARNNSSDVYNYTNFKSIHN